MSEYDFIQLNEQVRCPICNNVLAEFKTKNGPGAQITLDYKQVDRFYTHCGNCRNMIAFNLKKEAEDKDKKQRKLEDYDKQSKIY